MGASHSSNAVSTITIKPRPASGASTKSSASSARSAMYLAASQQQKPQPQEQENTDMMMISRKSDSVTQIRRHTAIDDLCVADVQGAGGLHEDNLGDTFSPGHEDDTAEDGRGSFSVASNANEPSSSPDNQRTSEMFPKRVNCTAWVDGVSSNTDSVPTTKPAPTTATAPTRPHSAEQKRTSSVSSPTTEPVIRKASRAWSFGRGSSAGSSNSRGSAGEPSTINEESKDGNSLLKKGSSFFGRKKQKPSPDESGVQAPAKSSEAFADMGMLSGAPKRPSGQNPGSPTDATSDECKVVQLGEATESLPGGAEISEPASIFSAATSSSVPRRLAPLPVKVTEKASRMIITGRGDNHTM